MTDPTTAYQLRQQASDIAALRQNIVELTAALRSHRDKLTVHDSEIEARSSSLMNLERSFQGFQQGIQGVQQDHRGVKLELENLRRRLSEELEAIKKAAQEVSTSSGTIKNIEDVPGYKTPYWYCVDVPVSAGAQVESVVTGSAEISPEGPFVITQIVPWYQIVTDDADFAFANGRVVPCSAGGPIMNQIGGVAFSANTDPGPTGLTNVVPELQFQIEISGSGRFWTNQFLPAAAFYGWPQPLFTGIMGWVETTDRVKIHVSPLRAVPLAGIVRFIMHGFQILNPNVRLSRVLGFTS